MTNDIRVLDAEQLEVILRENPALVDDLLRCSPIGARLRQLEAERDAALAVGAAVSKRLDGEVARRQEHERRVACLAELLGLGEQATWTEILEAVRDLRVDRRERDKADSGPETRLRLLEAVLAFVRRGVLP